MNARNVLVVGGAGFIGSRIVALLATQGRKVLVPVRRYEHAKHLIMLPGVEVIQAAIDSEAAVGKLLLHSSSAGKIDACVSLAGILHGRAGGADDPYGPDFSRVHVELPQRLALACQEHGVKRFLHMSALGVTEGGKKTLPSRYLRSKAAGEQVVRQTLGLQTTIFRPSVVFGEQDRFLNLFASLLQIAPFMPLACATARFQPVYVGDVANAFVNALDRNECHNRIYELAGPEIYTLRQLVELVGRLSGNPKPVVALPAFLGRLQAAVMEFLPGPTLMSRDNIDSMRNDNVLSVQGLADLPQTTRDLGLSWHALEPTVSGYLMNAAAAQGLNAFRSRAGR